MVLWRRVGSRSTVEECELELSIRRERALFAKVVGVIGIAGAGACVVDSLATGYTNMLVFASFLTLTALSENTYSSNTSLITQTQEAMTQNPLNTQEA